MNKYYLEKEDLTGTDFSNQILEGALFYGCNLTNCNFSGATLTYANMTDTIIDGANFTNARLFFSNFMDATGTADFTNAKVLGAPEFIDFIDADFTSSPPSEIPAKHRAILINSLVTQSGIIFTPDDIKVMNDFIDHGETGKILGTYDVMPNGNEVYTCLGLDPKIQIDSGKVIEKHMAGGIVLDDGIYIHLIEP